MDLRDGNDPLLDWLAQRACEKLIIQYTHLIDFGEAERVADLFAADGAWEAYRKKIKGREEIRKAFRLRQMNAKRVSRHICTNISIDISGPQTASGITYFTLFREHRIGRHDFVPFEGPKMVGDYLDQFVLTDEGWKFALRKVQIAFKMAGVPLLSAFPDPDASEEPQEPRRESGVLREDEF